MKETLEERCKQIYKEALDLYELHGDVVNVGLNVLYGPPMLHPSIFIVTFQGAGGGQKVQETWPEKLLFDDESVDGRHRFGNRLRKALSRTNTRYLLKTTMASCVIFPQATAKNAPQWKQNNLTDSYARWKEFSVEKCKELILLSKPLVILTFGKQAFEWINESDEPKLTYRAQNTEERGGEEKEPRDVVVKRYGQFGSIRIIGSGHLSQGPSDAEIDEVLKEVEQIVLRTKRRKDLTCSGADEA